MALSEKDAVDLVQAHVAGSIESADRQALERHWVDCVAFYEGVQRYARDVSGRLRLPRALRRASDEIRHVANLIRPSVLRNAAHVLRQNVQFTVRPASNDVDDLLAAEAGRDYFTWRLQSMEVQRRQLQVAMYASIAGLAFTKHYWDPTRGKRRRIYTDRPFQLLPGGQRRGGSSAVVNLTREEMQAKDDRGEYRDVPTGGPVVDVVPPFGVLWDPRVREDLDEAAWVDHQQLVHKRRLLELFPDRKRVIERLKPYDMGQSGVYWIELLSQLVGGQEALHSAPLLKRFEAGDVVLVHEHWIAPSEAHPRGARVVVAGGDQVLVNEDSPAVAAGMPHPFVAWNWYPAIGRLAGTGVVTDAIPPQVAYNEDRSRVREQIRQAGNPRTAVTKQSGVKEEHFSSRPNNLITYNVGNPPPVVLPAPPVPQYILEEINRAQQEADLAGAQAPIDRGELPNELRGSIGVRLLMDRSDIIRDPVLMVWRLSIAQWGKRELQLAQAHLKHAELVQITGRRRSRGAFYFTGADLRGNADVVVDTEPTPSDSQVGRVADIDFLLERGVLNPADPADKAAILDALRFKTDRDLWGAMQAERMDERDVVWRMVSEPGYVPAANPWDLSEPRLESINELRRNRIVWESLAPDTQQAINARADVYQARIQEAQMQQLALAQAMQGQPAEKGQPSSPKPRTQEVA